MKQSSFFICFYETWFIPLSQLITNHLNIMATKTVDQFRKSGERATIDDALILIECNPRRKVQPVEYVDFEPWDGKTEPAFPVQPPRDGKR